MHKKPFQLKAFMLLLILSAGMTSIAAQEVNIKGSVINPSQHPVGNVKVYLQSNPAVYCYSDSNGSFQLSSSTTSAAALVFNERISVNPDGSLQIHAMQNSLHIDIYDMLGRRVKEVIYMENLNGTYSIHPVAYLNDLTEAIYIAQVKVDEYSKGIKIHNLGHVEYPMGLIRIGDYAISNDPVLKSDAAEDDSLMFSHDFYKPARLAISSYTADVGVIQLENFGDYKVAEGMDPDKTRIDKHYGNFLKLTSEGDIEFEVNFDSASCFAEELFVKAIPISQLDFLPDSLEFISGIHLEPSGTKFLDLPEVWIKLPGRISDSLVVFAYNDDSNEIYYLPYYSYTEGFYGDNTVSYLQLYISHFSGIGVANGVIPDNTQSESKTSEDYISDLAYYQQQNENITPDVWTDYYEKAILSMFEGVNSLESLKQVVRDMLEYMVNRQLLGADTEYQDTQEYKDFLSILTQKIKELYDDYNDECTSAANDCERSKQGEKAIEVLALGQYFGLYDNLPDIHDFCDKELPNFNDPVYSTRGIINLNTGETYKLPIDVYNLKNELMDEKLIWSSNNPSVASVNQSGLVTGIDEGYTTINGSWCDVKSQVSVYVTKVDCVNEFCKHEECANGIFAGRGSLDYSYEGYNPTCEEIYVSDKINVEFRINLNKSSYREYTTSGVCHYMTRSRCPEFGETDFTVRYSRDTFTDKGYLDCLSSGGFQEILAYPIFIEKISYGGSAIEVRFGRRTANGTFYSSTVCGRTSQ